MIQCRFKDPSSLHGSKFMNPSRQAVTNAYYTNETNKLHWFNIGAVDSYGDFYVFYMTPPSCNCSDIKSILEASFSILYDRMEDMLLDWDIIGTNVTGSEVIDYKIRDELYDKFPGLRKDWRDI